MDCEKKNKEILEGVKKIHSGIKEVLAELGDSNLLLANILNEAVWALNKQFPELAESEDERIRRALLEVVSGIDGGWPFEKHRITKKEAIAYLGKQKEPDYLEKFIRLPHLNSDYEVVDDWAYTPSLAHCDGNWGVCWVHCEDGDTLHECIGDTPAEAIDKAVEWFTSLEKPIRAKEVGAIISSRDKGETACGYLERCLTPDMRKVWYEACDELKKACFQEAEKRKEKKPVEWSEKDENTIESIKGLITMGRFADTNTIRTIWELLDSLRPQPQKLEDWSEEDQLNLNWVIAILNGEPCDLDIQVESLISWLKSLRNRPKSSDTWKPSEEQMRPLHNFSGGMFIGDGDATALRSLYEDLKKQI